MAEAYYLSPRDKEWFQRLVRAEVRREINARGRTREDLSYGEQMRGADTYIARIPISGIPALTQEVGTGTGTALGTVSFGAGNTPGKRDCPVYKIVYAGDIPNLEAVPNLTRTIHNVSSIAIQGNQWLPVWKDNFGYWYAQNPGGTTLGGNYNIRVWNIHGTTAPAYGLLKITGYDTGFAGFNITRPNTNSDSGLLINGPDPIPWNHSGYATFSFPALCAFTREGPGTATGTAELPMQGEEWGSEEGNWYLSEGYTGYLTLSNNLGGLPGSIGDVCYVYPTWVTEVHCTSTALTVRKPTT